MRTDLNLLQTRFLARLFKKIEFQKISFEPSIDGGVLIRAVDHAGWEAVIDIDRFGKSTSFSKNRLVGDAVGNVNEDKQIQS